MKREGPAPWRPLQHGGRQRWCEFRHRNDPPARGRNPNQVCGLLCGAQCSQRFTDMSKLRGSGRLPAPMHTSSRQNQTCQEVICQNHVISLEQVVGIGWNGTYWQGIRLVPEAQNGRIASCTAAVFVSWNRPGETVRIIKPTVAGGGSFRPSQLR